MVDTSDVGPFADEKAQLLFWRYVLNKSQHLNDPTVTDEMNRCFAAWRQRKEQKSGAAKQKVLDAQRTADIIDAKVNQPTPPVAFTAA